LSPRLDSNSNIWNLELQQENVANFVFPLFAP
jgi:hypothetical protein